jgi:PAS domain-containing protein
MSAAAPPPRAGAAAPPPPAGVATFALLLHVLARHSLNGFAVVDASGRYAWVSDSMCTLLGVEKETLLGCAPHDTCVCVLPAAA